MDAAAMTLSPSLWLPICMVRSLSDPILQSTGCALVSNATLRMHAKGLGLVPLRAALSDNMEGSLGAEFSAASLCVLCDSWPLLPFCSYLVAMGYACAPGRHFACTLL